MFQALSDRIGGDLQSKISNTVVAVCGLGGLGSNIAVSLARAGVGRLILIDYDKVDISNLNRQQYKASQIGTEKALALTCNINEISPYTEVTAYARRVTENNYRDLLSDADIICEAFDAAEEKSMLVNLVLENMPDKYLVAASGMAGLGCANQIVTRRIMKRFYLCGDSVSELSEGEGLFLQG